MAILKWKKSLDEWVSFYAKAINNRLRRDLNLGDVTDKQAARDNLELTGNNNHTHYHDDRYMPHFSAVWGWAWDGKHPDTTNWFSTRNIKSLWEALAKEINDRINADIEEANARKKEDQNLHNAINSEASARSSEDSALWAAINGVKASNCGTAGSIKNINISGSKVGAGTVTAGQQTLTIDPGVSGGTYTLDVLLEQLSSMSHSHGLNGTNCVSDCVSDCDCDCNCNCNCQTTNCHFYHSH